jgi:dTDP-4-dehydrorhamnose reductase
VKLLILGSNGQLGREILRLAGEAPGIDPVGLTREDIDLGQATTIPDRLEPMGFDVLVNCAAYTAVDAAETDAEAAFAVNAYAVEEVARACRRAGARLVHVGTDYVFDGEADRPYRPDDAPAPINVYGASKLAGEALARRAHSDGTLVVRTSSVFGQGGNFVRTILRAGAERGHLRVVDDVVMAPTYAADLAAGILALLAAEPAPGTYHLTNDGRATWHELAAAALAMGGVEATLDAIPSSEYPTPARRPRFSVLDNHGTTEIVGLLPDWRDALRRYLTERPDRLLSQNNLS